MTESDWSLWSANPAPHSYKFAFTFVKSLCVTGQLIANIHAGNAEALPRSELPTAPPLSLSLEQKHLPVENARSRGSAQGQQRRTCRKKFLGMQQPEVIGMKLQDERTACS
jgi:hypothetical protein